jgi:dCMP deaminase
MFNIYICDKCLTAFETKEKLDIVREDVICPRCKKSTERLSWDDYFVQMTQLISQRSTCLKRKVGAVIVKDNQILATGYNGSPSGTTHCTDIGECNRSSHTQGCGLDYCRSTHAEMNAIASCAKRGISCENATIYINTFPCSECTKLIINAGIKEIVFVEDYNAPLSKELLKETNIIIRQY